MGRFRGRIRNLQRAADVELVVEHEDGTTSRFREKDIMDAFLHEYGRGGRHFDGEEPGEAHPVVVALRTATNLDSLMSEQGTIVGHMLGEDEIIRGLRERPGPPVEWNAGGTVCEWSVTPTSTGERPTTTTSCSPLPSPAGGRGAGVT